MLISSTQYFKQSTLADYARVPVSQFGAALLRGMGWKEGTPATRHASRALTAPTKAHVPESRPALLGIGAKSLESVMGPGETGKGGKRKGAREEMRFVPLLKRDKGVGEGSESSRSVSLSFLFFFSP